MRKILTLILTDVVAIVSWQSCNSVGCTDNQNALPLAGLFSSETKQAITLSGIAVGGVGAPHDSLLYRSNQSLKEIYFPFRAAERTTSFYLHYTQSGLDDPMYNDTITFNYDASPQFVSEDCGAMYFYTITSSRYTTHLIDSVKVTDPYITNIDQQRIQIYFRTRSQTPAAPDEPENPDNPSEEEEEEEEA
ncbi:MAG: hypothetical protein K2M94_08175 [Paramuribaculum sp.]|nr:hypothetical protein [Paramuribaculum sp.]